MSNPSDKWDADERNKRNDLGKYLDSLSRHQQQMIKGIKSKNAFHYLQLEEEDFKNMLQDSLTLAELKRLSREEIQFRNKLIEEVVAVWRRHKEDIKEFQKEQQRRSEYSDAQASEGWMPKHHELEPLEFESGEYKKRKLSVSQAARLHEAENVTVRGVLSGVQPLRKMYKGISVECLKCGIVWTKAYDKPELFPSFVHRIKICVNCKSGKWLKFPPTYDKINALVAFLKDENTFSEIDPIRIIVFGDDEPAYDDTLDIERHLGEPIEVTGDIYSVDVSKNRHDSKIVVFLYVKYLIDYVAKKDVQLSAEDVKAIKRFVDYVGPDNVVDKLTEMFATSVIRNDSVKKGLLLCAASTSMDKKIKKLHTILVGDVGLAKSELLKNAVEILPGSRYENMQFATGKSLTAIVSKDEGDSITLRTGPIPQAKGAIAALNEIGKMTPEDQGFLYDIMQEQEFSTNKHGRWFHVDAPTAIIASGNPIGGSWKSEYDNSDDIKIDLDKIPTVKPLLDRFPLIFIFIDDRSEKGLTEYALKKSEMEIRPRPDYTAYIQKHILYSKQRYPKPKLSEEARSILNQYYVGVRKRYGSPRIMNTIQRIAQTIASLKLKDTIDENDANDTVTFYNIILRQWDMVVALPSSPRDAAYEECLSVLMESSSFPMAFEEVIKTVCERNQQVAAYIGKSFSLENNKKLRPIVEMLRNHSRVQETKSKPIVFQYMPKDDLMVKASEQASDPSDQYDHTSDTSEKNDEKNISEGEELQKKILGTFDGVSGGRSYRSYRSDSTPETEGDNVDAHTNPFLYCCYHCEDFHTNNQDYYENHMARYHYRLPAYPSVADLRRHGLKAQGKTWER
jgi:DNA replicative helicase MCM subunit Mcm2 (Cdc46/Mcm family)